MKISIIVPVYNVEKYLPRCLDSLVNQSLDNYEVILVNDGSPDNSQQIIDEYKERYTHIIKSLVIDNGGQGRARNFGLEMAQGEYIGFVDSDDWLDINMYESMYNAAVKENADIVMCDFVCFFPDGREEHIDREFDLERPYCAAGSCCDKIFRRTLVEGMRFPEGVWYEDFSYSARALLKANKVVHMKKAFYHYRCGHISTMRNTNSLRNLEIIEILDGIRCEVPSISGTECFDELVIDHVLLDSISRVSLHKTRERNAVIEKLCRYSRENVPDLRGSAAFKRQGKNRRIVMWLNYHGLHDVSRLLLEGKKRLKNR